MTTRLSDTTLVPFSRKYWQYQLGARKDVQWNKYLQQGKYHVHTVELTVISHTARDVKAIFFAFTRLYVRRLRPISERALRYSFDVSTMCQCSRNYQGQRRCPESCKRRCEHLWKIQWHHHDRQRMESNGHRYQIISMARRLSWLHNSHSYVLIKKDMQKCDHFGFSTLHSQSIFVFLTKQVDLRIISSLWLQHGRKERPVWWS